VLLDVACHEGLDRGSVVGIEVATVDEVVGQGSVLLERPRLEGGHQLRLVDQSDLEGEQAEEQITIRGDGCHGPQLPVGRRDRWAFGTRGRAPAARPRRIGWIISRSIGLNSPGGQQRPRRAAVHRRTRRVIVRKDRCVARSGPLTTK
jgi:hypothetical protein